MEFIVIIAGVMLLTQDSAWSLRPRPAQERKLLSQVTKKKIVEIAQRHFKNFSDSVVLMAVGSLARGELTKSSDLDIILLYDDTKIDWEKFIDIRRDLFRELDTLGFELEVMPVYTLSKVADTCEWNFLVYLFTMGETNFLAGSQGLYKSFQERVAPFLKDIDKISADFIRRCLYRDKQISEREPLYAEAAEVSPEFLKYGKETKRDIDFIRWMTKYIVGAQGIDPAEAEFLNQANQTFLNLRDEPIMERQEFDVMRKKVYEIYMRLRAISFASLKKQKGAEWAQKIENFLDDAASLKKRIPEKTTKEFCFDKDLSLRLAALWTSRDKTSLYNVYRKFLHKDWATMAVLALNIHSPQEVLDELGRFQDPRYENIRLFVARNPSTPVQTLRFIADNRWFRTVEQGAAEKLLHQLAEVKRLGSLAMKNYKDTKNFGKAAEYASSAAKLNETIGDKARAAAFWSIAGNSYYQQGKFIEAAECDERAGVLNEELGNLERVVISWRFAAKNWAMAGSDYFKSDKFKEAGECYKRSAELNEKLYQVTKDPEYLEHALKHCISAARDFAKVRMHKECRECDEKIKAIRQMLSDIPKTKLDVTGLIEQNV